MAKLGRGGRFAQVGRTPRKLGRVLSAEPAFILQRRKETKCVGRLFYYGRRAPRCRGRSGLRTPGTRLAGTRIVGTGFEWRFGAAQAPRCGRFAHHATHFRCPAKEGDNPGAHAEKSGGRAQCGATRGRLECCSFGDLGPRRTRGRLSQHVRLRHHPAAEQWRQQQQP